MSDGKKFLGTSPEDKSPEDRLASLEAKIPILIERIQAYDKIIDDSRALNKRVDSLERAISEIKSVVNTVIPSVDALKCRHIDDSKLSSAAIEELKKSVSILSRMSLSLSDQIEKDAQDKQLGLSKLSADVAFLSTKAVLKEDFSSNISPLKQDVTNLFADSTEKWGQIVALKEVCRKHEGVHREVQSSVAKVDGKISSINADFSVFPKELKDLDARLTYDINQRFMVFFEKTNTRLDALSVQLIPQGVSLKEVKASFEGKLEGFKLDVTNSLLKAGNNTQQIVLLEKKLENLRLLMNKYFIESGASVPNYDERASP